MQVQQMEFDFSPQEQEGFRQFMLSMYNHTAGGLAVSFVTAMFVWSSGLMSILMTGPMLWVTMLAPLGMIFYYSYKGDDWDLKAVTAFYYAFVAVMGVGLSSVFAIFSANIIVEEFLVTSLTFGAASAYGYITKRDLSGMGSFLMIGLIGIIIAFIVNIFLQSTAFALAISIIGIGVFLGLTMWDTQMAKRIYAETGDPRWGVRFALSLYLNFINLFQLILSFTGMRGEE
jgi:FtsH-binding integral membrane protein